MRKNNWGRFHVAVLIRTLAMLSAIGIAVGVTALVSPSSLMLVGIMSSIVAFSVWSASLIQSAKDYKKSNNGFLEEDTPVLTKFENKTYDFFKSKLKNKNLESVESKTQTKPYKEEPLTLDQKENNLNNQIVNENVPKKSKKISKLKYKHKQKQDQGTLTK